MSNDQRSGCITGKIGRRGAALLFFGLLDIIQGFSFLDPTSLPVALSLYRVLLQVLPFTGWGYVWIGIGTVLIAQAFVVNDALAFGLAIAIKLVWGFGFLGAYLTDHTNHRGYLGAAVWLAMAAFVAVISGWPEVVRRK